MLTHITAALGGPPPRPDRQPVRRHSRLAGRCEAVFWRRTDRREVRRVLLAARKYEVAGRQPGRRNGPLGHVGLELLELLGNLVDFRSGRLEPCVAYLMEKLRRSKSAIYDALNALKAHGFLDWLRRYEPTGREGRGPQVRQTSNAYRMVLPPRAARLVGCAVPLPDDLHQDLEDRRQALQAMKDALPLEELAVVEVDNGPLARALAMLGRRVQERGSASRSESQTKALPL